MPEQESKVEDPSDSKYRSSYLKETILHPGKEGGRDLEQYKKELLIDEDRDLRDKTVLDLGAGVEDKFAREAREKNIGATIMSLSPDFSDQKIAENTKTASPDGTLIAGVGQLLPFRAETFDRIYAFHVLEHLRNKEVIQNVIKEMGRTLKIGGTAKFGPFLDGQKYRGYNDFTLITSNEQFIDALKAMNIELSCEYPDIPPVERRIYLGASGPGIDVSLRRYNLVITKRVEIPQSS